ncbi:MAG: hypothetical protein KGH64_06070 [Candidatus Micrarchaeota archaeon]|nr:hypothetical protein [Candidatus Micrarchaeota archaeon]MDE1834873.1 hypothetical protein [Candidatus Micrarchaeota archaeon]
MISRTKITKMQRRAAWKWAIAIYKKDKKQLGDLADLVGSLIGDTNVEVKA